MVVVTSEAPPDGAARACATPSLLDYLDSAASARGTVEFVAGGETCAWSALWTDAHRRAGWLDRNMASARVLAGILEPTRACLVTLLGCWLSGRRFASLPRRSRGMDLAEYRAQVGAMLALAQADALIVPSPDHSAPTDVRTFSFESLGFGPAATGSASGTLVQFTSGSTDRPRGVVVDMGHLGANVRGIATSLGYSERDVFFSWLPLSHDMGLVGMCLASLAAFSPELGGASQLWLSDPERFLRDPGSWLRLGSEVGGTTTMAPNFALELAVRHLDRPGTRLDLSALRTLVVGSETVSAATLTRFGDAGGGHGLRGDALCPGYGLAEATLAVTGVLPGEGWKARPRPGQAEEATPVVSLGRPLPETEVRIGRREDGVGEIEVAGTAVASTFLGRETPLTDDGWLRTGDLGFVHDGELFFVGRTANRVVVAGRNIDAEALQRRVGDLGGVRTGCCAVIPEGTDHFAVVVEPSATADPARPEDLCGEVADLCTSFVGVAPARVVVIERGQLPKTPTGKLQPQRLRTRLVDGELRPLADVRRRAAIVR